MKYTPIELGRVIAAFRALETNEDAIPVLGDEDAMRCLTAWSKTDQKWKKPKGKQPEMTSANHGAVWAWIVAGWTLDFVAISEGSGCSQRIVHDKMKMLCLNRLIYPDGQMSKAARTALNVHVAAKLGVKQRPPKKQSTPADRSSGSENDNN